jgi:hypothetical protein
MVRASVPILTALLVAGCNEGTTEATTDADKPTNSDQAVECVEPQNPFGDEGGHDAGFKWAQENGGVCDTDSLSFNEGCEDYHEQLKRYQECQARKDK